MSKAILKSLAVLGALAISTSAYANPVQISKVGSDAHGTYGSVNATLYSPAVYGGTGSHGASVGAFELKGDLGEGLQNFVAFCADISHALNLSSSYDVVDDGSIPTFSSSRVDNVLALFNMAFDALDLTMNSQSAGFQMALWELLYETSDTLQVDARSSNSGFKVTGSGSGFSAAVTYANGLLDDLADWSGPEKYRLIALESTNGRQDLVTVGLAPPAPVPLPAAGLLLLAGLAGLGAAARRRKAA